MYKIVKKELFSPVTFLWEVEAKDLAEAAHPGQFVIVRLQEGSERIPLTIADFDKKRGTVTLVVQVVGKSTEEMSKLPEGAELKDLCGPLGIPSHVKETDGKVVFVGGGLGIAPVYPILRAHKGIGNYTISIIGFRNKDLVFWEDKFKQQSDEMYITTDDGSYGRKGLVIDPLKELLAKHKDIKEVVAIGPLIMMKATADTTRSFGVKTIVSLNTIMVDGMGMCGGCRVTVAGKDQFACVDGPDFDAHQVDFNELMKRQRRFVKEEKSSLEKYHHECELKKAGKI
ncbi:MAG: sulfide/dihydroorotate dehydrogenase-like FAD/NAD-binding protein [Deltaproteobacteria bacterium]|nr:sulfide/dihydroorotate dehydrogenase-like FAD/NAD-binding protein [Deltaproteobacteria bacterium]